MPHPREASRWRVGPLVLDHPLATQIARDRQTLDRVMRQLSIPPSAIKVGMVRIAERVGRLKLNGGAAGSARL